MNCYLILPQGGVRTFNGAFNNDWTITETRSVSGSQTITFNTVAALSGPIDPADTIVVSFPQSPAICIAA